MKTTASISYKFISTPGHGYLRVPLAELKELGIADKISGYSGMDSKYAYLEEDCDAPLFLQCISHLLYSIEQTYSETFNKKHNYEFTF
jgi:hypothetical protein